MQRIFNAMQKEKIISIKVEVLTIDSTSCKVYPDAHGVLKNTENKIGKSKGGWSTKLHVVSANNKVIVQIHLSDEECHDAPEGQISIEKVGKDFKGVPILMDRAYEGDKTRKLAFSHGHEPIVLLKKNRINSWQYDKELYKQRNVIERFFRWLKEFRRVYTRYDKTDCLHYCLA